MAYLTAYHTCNLHIVDPNCLQARPLLSGNASAYLLWRNYLRITILMDPWTFWRTIGSYCNSTLEKRDQMLNSVHSFQHIRNRGRTSRLRMLVSQSGCLLFYDCSNFSARSPAFNVSLLSTVNRTSLNSVRNILCTLHCTYATGTMHMNSRNIVHFFLVVIR